MKRTCEYTKVWKIRYENMSATRVIITYNKYSAIERIEKIKTSVFDGNAIVEYKYYEFRETSKERINNRKNSN